MDQSVERIEEVSERIRIEIDLLRSLNCIIKAEIKGSDKIIIEYKISQAVIRIELKYTDREKMNLLKISTGLTKSLIDGQKLSVFINEFINEFEWRDSVRLKHFFEK